MKRRGRSLAWHRAAQKSSGRDVSTSLRELQVRKAELRDLYRRARDEMAKSCVFCSVFGCLCRLLSGIGRGDKVTCWCCELGGSSRVGGVFGRLQLLQVKILGDLTIEVSQSLLLSMYSYHVSYARFAVSKCDLYQSGRQGKVVLIIGLVSYDKGESDAWDIKED